MRGMLLGLALVMGAGAVRGDVLVPYDNSINSNGSLLLNTHNGYAQKFTTGNFGASPLAVKTISVALFISTNNTNDTSFSVGIYANNSGSPGTVVGTVNNFTSSNLGTDRATANYSVDVSSNNINLSSITTYWLTVFRTTPDGTYDTSTYDQVAWAAGSTSGTAGDARQTLDLGTAWTDVNPANNSFAGQIVMVPEPGTLLLGGIAAACGGGGVWWRRKRKAAPVADEAVVAE